VDSATGQNSGGPETAQRSTVRVVKTKAVSGVQAIQSGASADLHVGTMKTASLRLVFGEESWTEIMDGDGKMISSQINPAGSELNLDGLLPLSLVIGHALATQLYVDGEPVNLVPYSNSTSEVARITLQ
jgi:cytoskeleton protein RodZ